MTVAKKLIIYKVLLFAFAFFIAFMPSTALRSKEVNSRVIVEILGVDSGEQVSLTAQYAMPAEGKDAASKDTVTVKSETLSGAVEALNIALGRRAELGHCSIVIMGKDTDAEILGAVMTATDVTADVMLAAAKDKAEDLIGEITDFMKKTGATDADFIAYSAHKSQIATNTLLGFLSDLGSASKTACVPLVEMLKSEQSSQGQGGGQGGQGGQGGGQGGQNSQGGNQGSEQGGQKTDQTGMRVDRLAVYDADGFAGVLEPEAARGVAWVNVPIEKGTLCADVDFNGRLVKGVCGRLLKKHTSVKADKDGGKAIVKIKAFIEPNGDKFNALIAEDDKEAFAAIKEGYKKKITQEIQSAYLTSRLLGCDPLFIGRQFYRYCPSYFKSEYNYHAIDLEIKVDIALK